MGKDKVSKKQNVKLTAPKAPAPPPIPVRVAPLFRKFDWIATLFTFAIVWGVYLYTLAPEQTLEDSGELCTGAFYAGIPHPPGYPFWTIYAWLWTKLLPIGNVAWRVEVGQSMAAAMACGLVALMVSRGSSMLMEGIEELKALKGKWENAICIVSGVTAGLLLGFGGVMWSESVAINRISLFGVPWMMLVLVCLMRWIYAPHQRRYLFVAMFFFGICATIHQTLLVAAMGIEVAIIMTQPRIGRDVLFGNSVIYLLMLVAKQNNWVPQLLQSLDNPIVAGLFHAIGVTSIAACIFYIGKTKRLATEWKVCVMMLVVYALGVSFYFYEPIAGMTDPPMQWGYPRTVEGFFHALSRGQYEKANPSDVFGDPGRFITQLGILVGDIAGEFDWVCVFIALAPLLFFFKMQKRERSWIAGLVAIYFCIGVLLLVLMNPSPDKQSAELSKVFFTTSHGIIAIMIGYGLALTAAYMAAHYREFRAIGLMLGIATLVPGFLALYNGVDNTFYGSVGQLPFNHIILLYLLLTAAFVVAALGAQRFRRMSEASAAVLENNRIFFWGFAIAALLLLGASIYVAFFSEGRLGLGQMFGALPRIFVPNQFCLPVLAGLLIFGSVVIFIGSLVVYRQRAPLVIVLGLFLIIPLASGLSHWASSEQRNHWFGYWFGHDMFTPPFKGSDGKPLYPEMARNTILYGGTDPGRFCPTYMIFCESFIPDNCKPKEDQKFDRRDVYLITQNALANGTYLEYLRAQYFRSQQLDPPFFRELARQLLKDPDYETNLLAKIVSPLDTCFTARGAAIEKRWRTSTSRFDDGSFTNLSAYAARLRPGENQDALSKWLFQNFSKETQELLARQADERRLRPALITDLNRLLERELELKKQLQQKQEEKASVDQKIYAGNNSERVRKRSEECQKEIDAIKIDPLYETNRFAQVAIPDYLQRFIAQNPQGDTRIRLNRLLLEAAYPNEIGRSLGGVYPDREIYIASPDDSQRCFQEYTAEVGKRVQHDRDFPNEPRQIRQGEDVKIIDNRVQVSGQVAVMGINGLITKVIFDHNPDNEFYVEESFPLDWMYPHLTPFGIIMKINRQPLPELTEDICRRDHGFWSQYSDRLIGNWITYDTTVKEIAEFVEKVYLRHNFSGFKGDRRFIRDDQAQKAFSKLRSSIGGVYAWRLSALALTKEGDYRAKSNEEIQRLLKEANFTFMQAFAFCPYSPEAVFRYVQLLTQPQIGRYEDALIIAETCLKLDPYNGSVIGLVANLRDTVKRIGEMEKTRASFQQMQDDVRKNPTNFQAAFNLASAFLSVQQTNAAMAVFDRVLSQPHVDPSAVLSIAMFYRDAHNYPKLETTLEKLVKVMPEEPETWYDLAALKSGLGNPTGALTALTRALDLNAKRLQKNPAASNLLGMTRSDQRFDPLRQLPEFQKLVQP